MSGLTKSQCARVYSWLTFFLKKHRKYFFAGRLVGPFFDSEGHPTPALTELLQCAGVEDGVIKMPEVTNDSPVVEAGRLFTRQELKELGEARERDGSGPILLR